jgi:GAF domain-containing protein
MLDAPIRIDGKNIGIICYEHIGPMRHWTLEEGDFARSISDLCANRLLEKRRQEAEEKLYLMAHYDVLTNLPNRSLFVDRFKRAIAHSQRT